MSDGSRAVGGHLGVEDVIEDLVDARRGLETASEAVESVGRAEIERLESATEDLRTLFSTYEDSAIGTESFGAFVKFRAELDSLLDSLPDSLPEREVFERIGDRFDKQRLHRSDFEWARSELDAVEAILDLRSREIEARDRYRRLRRTARARREALAERRDRLERLHDRSQLELDAPIDELRGPIEAYNEAVSAAFDDFLRTSTAREVVAFLETSDRYPLVPMRSLPSDVVEFIKGSDAGTLTLPDLLEYAEYSRSKLQHYVDDPDTLKRTVSTQRTAIDRIDASPLQIDWPPPPADDLRWRIREQLPLVDRIADASVIERLRDVRSMADTDEYDRLRRVAVVRSELTDDEWALIREGRVSAALDETERAIDRLETELAADPTAE